MHPREAVAVGVAVATLVFVPASLNVAGTITGPGGIATSYTAGSARWVIDAQSIRGEDGTTNDYGGGPGVTAAIKADGSAFFQKILLQTFGSGARMVLDSTVPIFKIIDSAGITRAELGNLATKGISAGGYKFRASNASDVPIFDSDGLIGVMQIIGTQDSGAASGGTGSVPAGDYAIPNSTMSFTVTRQVTVLLMATFVGNIFDTVTQTSGRNVFMQVTGQSAVAWGAVYCAAAPAAAIDTSTTLFQTLSLPAGTYSAVLYWHAITGTSGLNYSNTLMHAFQLGG